jgi:hypothetical protein
MHIQYKDCTWMIISAINLWVYYLFVITDFGHHWHLKRLHCAAYSGFFVTIKKRLSVRNHLRGKKDRNENIKTDSFHVEPIATRVQKRQQLNLVSLTYVPFGINYFLMSMNHHDLRIASNNTESAYSSIPCCCIPFQMKTKRCSINTLGVSMFKHLQAVSFPSLLFFRFGSCFTLKVKGN